MEEQKELCAIYRRVSTKDELQDKSYSDQEIFMRDFVERSDKYELYKIYSDKLSGTKLLNGRKEFEEMLKDAGLEIISVKSDVVKEGTNERKVYTKFVTMPSGKKPKFTTILCKDTSRFARNIKVAEILEDLSGVGVYVDFLDVSKSTRDKDDISIIKLLQNFDEMYSRDLSRKVSDGNKRSRERGTVRTNRKLYGYTYLPKTETGEENNRLVMVPNEAEIIVEIFRLYNGCYTITNTEAPEPLIPCNFKCSECLQKDNFGLGFANLLDSLNLVLGRRTRSGKHFAQTTIKHIIENEKYYGANNSGKYDHGTVFDRTNAARIRDGYQDNLNYVPSLIEPIIRKELFDLCTSKRAVRAGEFKTMGMYRSHPTKYKGKFICGNCGSVYIHNKSNDGKGYYNCKLKKLKGAEVCRNTNVFDYQIEEYIEKLCASEIYTLISQDGIKLALNLINFIRNNVTALSDTVSSTVITDLRTKIDEDNGILQSLYIRAASSKTANKEALEKSIEKIEKDIQENTKKYNILTKEPTAYLDESYKALKNCYDILDLVENSNKHYTTSEIFKVIDKIKVYGVNSRPESGVYEPPKPDFVPILKTTALASQILNIDTSDYVVDSTYMPEYMFQKEVPFSKYVRKDLDSLKISLDTLKAQYS